MFFHFTSLYSTPLEELLFYHTTYRQNGEICSHMLPPFCVHNKGTVMAPGRPAGIRVHTCMPRDFGSGMYQRPRVNRKSGPTCTQMVTRVHFGWWPGYLAGIMPGTTVRLLVLTLPEIRIVPYSASPSHPDIHSKCLSSDGCLRPNWKASFS